MPGIRDGAALCPGVGVRRSSGSGDSGYDGGMLMRYPGFFGGFLMLIPIEDDASRRQRVEDSLVEIACMLGQLRRRAETLLDPDEVPPRFAKDATGLVKCIDDAIVCSRDFVQRLRE
jgi:hypothetical protein